MKWNYTIITSIAAGILLMCVVLIHSGFSVSFAREPPEFFTEQYLDSGTDDYEPSSTSVEAVEHWLPDWYNLTLSEMDTLLFTRLKGIRERCQTYGGLRNQWRSFPPIVMRRSRNIEYCATAKAGSTFWKRLLEATKYRGRRQEKDGGARIRLTTMRNPWHRLVSTYLQKIGAKSQPKWEHEVREMCIRKFKTKPNFKEFVKYCVLGKWRNKRYNIHWLPTTERCNICNGHYDYVVAVENMATEAYHVLQQAGINDPEDIFNKTRENSIRANEKKQISASYQDYYRNMDPGDIEDLKKFYSFDIYVLQYPHSPFVDFAKS